jgi:hypothetical protein
VNIAFENGVTANLTLHGFSEREGRTLRIDGTQATLFGTFRDSGQEITVFNHYSGKEKVIYSQNLETESVHGGGDYLLIRSFLDSIASGTKQPLTNARESLESHLMAFAAHKSRLEDIVIQMDSFRKKAENLN